MKQFRELDLSSLEQFKPSDLMGNPISALERGKPMQVPLQQMHGASVRAEPGWS